MLGYMAGSFGVLLYDSIVSDQPSGRIGRRSPCCTHPLPILAGDKHSAAAATASYGQRRRGDRLPGTAGRSALPAVAAAIPRIAGLVNPSHHHDVAGHHRRLTMDSGGSAWT